MVEKELLLDSVQDIQKDDENISFRYLLITLLFVSIVLLVLGPKIYLSNNVYYKSLEFNKTLNQYNTLKEENSSLLNEISSLNIKMKHGMWKIQIN